MAKATKKAARGRRRRRTRRSWLGGAIGRGLRALAVRALIVIAVAVLGYGAWLDITVRGQFEGRRWQVPARIYARAMELYPGARINRKTLERELTTLGYRADSGLTRSGSFRRSKGALELRTRRFRFWDGEEPARRVRVRFDRAGVRDLRDAKGQVALMRLEPALIARVDPRHGEDRVLVRLDDVPKAVVGALLAVEDRSFFEHSGVSLRGIARALLANVRAGSAVQGGSTITQQLAKNYFLSAERTLWRKLNDMAIALILELRYDKLEILEAYLNEVYLGQQGPRAIHGFGLAARFYFARPLEELNLSEAALLVAMVRGPSYYNPRRHPERARERRNRALAQMHETGLINAKQLEAASASPLGVTKRPGTSGRRYAAFVDLVRRQLARDYASEDLQADGLRIFTSLDPQVQDAAQGAVRKRLATLEPPSSNASSPLQSAAVVVEPQAGEVLALVGAREDTPSGFNRALDARRQVGSLLKPVVYLGALADPRYSLVTMVDDVPVSLTDRRGNTWSPGNYDGEAHGPVPLMLALARSLNLATVNLGLAIGVERIVSLLEQLGLPRTVKPYPSLLLGAVEMTPLEAAQIYQSLAAGGFRQPLRAIRDVTTAEGTPLTRYGLDVSEAAPAEAVFLLQRAMMEVMRSGTARGARARLPIAASLAGKTGTTDDLRDSWFAGFGADRLAVVWIGRDDNSSAGLTGARGALEVWTDIMARVGVRPLSAEAPAGVEWYGVDLAAGLRFDASCGVEPTLPFLASTSEPVLDCARSAAVLSVPGFDASAEQTEDGR